MKELTTKTIRDIALEMPVSTRVFEELKIDYCCGGRRFFNEACQLAGVSPVFAAQKISAALKNASDGESVEFAEKKSPSELADYIVEKHHIFSRNEIGRLTNLMENVCHKHGKQNPELATLRKIFRTLCDDLMVHMRREEFILFPYIKNLEMSREHSFSMPFPHFGTVQNPIRMMMLEHDNAGEILKEMSEITNNYSVPETACLSFKTLYSGLRELEKDLHQHIHLENNILFPNAIELEQKVLFGGK